MSVYWTRQEGGIWRAVVDRRDVKNAIDLQTMDDLDDLITEAEGTEDLRVLTLRGAGDSFVSGGDLRAFADFTDNDEVARMARRMKEILRRLEGLDCWTVACINGDAYGGGCEMSLAFDFRIIAANARLGFVQARYAIPPGWGGLTRLVHAVGRSQALLWLAKAELVDADTALRAGLVDEVAPSEGFDDAVDELVSRLAKNSPRLIATLKAGAKRALTMERDEAIRAELEPFCDLWMTDEHRARIEAFFQRGKS